MSFAQTAKRAVQAVTGKKTVHAQMRTGASWPIEVRDPATGLMEPTSRHLRCGVVYEFDPADPQFVERLERRNLFIVEEVRDDSGRKSWVGVEPLEPPVMGAPISQTLDPSGIQAEEMSLLRRIAGALDRVSVTAKVPA